jgi:hypothetical protein
MSSEELKDFKELYIRGLSSEESAKVKVLQVRFDEKTATGAAKRAIFGYSDLEKRLKDEQEETARLRTEARELQSRMQELRQSVNFHFELESKLQQSQKYLLDAVNPKTKDHASGR